MSLSEIEQLKAALQLIGNLPLEFNSRARAIAQNSVSPPKGGWRDTLTPTEIGKLLKWVPAQIVRKEKEMDGRNPEYFTPCGNHQCSSYDNSKDSHCDIEFQPGLSVNGCSNFKARDVYLPPAIEMIPVESSNLLGFGHDSDKTLRVWFKNGTSYDYVGIEEGDFFDLVNAESPGKAYNALVKSKGVKGIKLAEVV